MLNNVFKRASSPLHLTLKNKQTPQTKKIRGSWIYLFADMS